MELALSDSPACANTSTTVEARREIRPRRPRLGFVAAFYATLRVASASDTIECVSFTDLTQDAQRISGLVTWAPPENLTGITHYEVWQAADIENSYGTQLWDFNEGNPRASVPVGTNQINVIECWRVTTEAETPAVSLIVIPSPSTDKSTWGHAHLWDDTNAVPPPTQLTSFTFSGYDSEDMVAGTLSWAFEDPLHDTAFLTHFAIYFALNADGAYRQFHTYVPVTATSYQIPEKTHKGSANCVLLYGHNPRGTSKDPVGGYCFTPSAYEFTTTTHTFTTTSITSTTTMTEIPELASISNVTFSDSHPDPWTLSGQISWNAPSNVEDVLHYVVTLAHDELNLGAAELVDASLSTVVPVGTNSLHILPHVWRKTKLLDYPANFIVVRAFRSDLGRLQPLTQAGVTAIYDMSSKLPADATTLLESLSFLPQEGMKSRWDGTVRWQRRLGADLGFVSNWDIYLAKDAEGNGKRHVASTPAAAYKADLSVAEEAGDTCVLVYARNQNGLSQLPLVAYLRDDLRPLVTSIDDASLDPAIQDVSFQDSSAAANKISGLVTWAPPENLTGITHYEVWQAADIENSYGTQLWDTNDGNPRADIPVGTNHMSVMECWRVTTHAEVPAVSIVVIPSPSYDKSRWGHTHIWDDSGSHPATIELSEFTFTRSDAQDQFGGTLHWTLQDPQPDTGTLSHWGIYLASDSSGANRAFHANVLVTERSFTIPDGTTQGSANCVLLYGENPRGTSTTPSGTFCFTLV